MRAQTIESLEDPRVAIYHRMRDPELKRHGLFIIEGRTNVRCLIEGARFRPHSVFLTPAGLSGLGDALAKLSSETPIYVASQSVINGIVGYNMHRGVVAAAECRSPVALSDLPAAPGEASLLVALEQVSNAENVGSIFRNAAAFGAGGILLCPRCCDPLYRKVVRVSMGAVLQLPFARCDAWPDPLTRLRKEGYRVVALHPGAEAMEIADFVAWLGCERDRAQRLLLVLGSEGPGLSQAVLDLADVRVRIGMAPGADSVNVGTASGIALHHLARTLPAVSRMNSVE